MTADGRGRKTGKGRAVPSTTPAGCGRGRDGRGSDGPREDVRGTPGRRAGGVKGTRGSSRGPPEVDGSSWPPIALHELTPPWCGQLMQRGFTLPWQDRNTQRD